MEKVDILDAPDLGRRRFFSAAAVALAAAELGMIRSARAEGSAPNQLAARAAASFGPLKQIDAGDLNVGYVVDVAPLLTSAGYRVIAPYLRGYGTTRFLSSETPRNGEQAAIGVDTIALLDALQIQKAIVAGFDWGARTADIVAALWPESAAASSQSAAILSAARKRAGSRCRRALSCNGGTNIISRPTAAEPATSNTCASLRS